MPVAEQYILTHVPEPKLFTLLVLLTFDIRVLDFLDIKCCHFYNDFRNGQYLMYFSDDCKVRINLILYGRR